MHNPVFDVITSDNDGINLNVMRVTQQSLYLLGWNVVTKI